jgi:hypothetical protein
MTVRRREARRVHSLVMPRFAGHRIPPRPEGRASSGGIGDRRGIPGVSR